MKQIKRSGKEVSVGLSLFSTNSKGESQAVLKVEDELDVVYIEEDFFDDLE